MDSNTADVIVIGSGPGGEGAAMQLAKSGKRVKLIERFAQVGGGCTHWGTIPSKALRFSIYQLTEVLSLPLMRACGVSVNFTMADLKSRTESIVHQQESLRRGFFDRLWGFLPACAKLPARVAGRRPPEAVQECPL